MADSYISVCGQGYFSQFFLPFLKYINNIFKDKRQTTELCKIFKMTNIFKRFLKYIHTYLLLIMHRSLSGAGRLRWFWPFILPPPTNSTQNSKNEPCFYRIAHILLDLIGTDTAHKTFAIYWTYGWLKRPCSQKTNIDGKTSSIKIDHFHRRNNPNCVL